jgi:adenosylcobinamide-GDP ribazoletransferase
VAFLTVLGGVGAPGRASAGWFPLVGTVLGLVVGGMWWVANLLWPPLLAAALVVVVDLALTGMLHFDGLVDSADGLLPAVDRTRRLEVMADPAVGAFGVGAGAAVLLLRTGALASAIPSPLLVGGLWCASRTAMAAIMRLLPYARSGGLADLFSPGSAVPLLGGLALSGVLAAAGSGPAGLIAVVAGLLAAAGVAGLARRRIGGFTGDVLGAAGFLAETVGLLAVSARGAA